MQELTSIPTTVTKEDLIGRVDLRNKNIFEKNS